MFSEHLTGTYRKFALCLKDIYRFYAYSYFIRGDRESGDSGKLALFQFV